MMKTTLVWMMFVLLSSSLIGQVVINELDCDTPSLDDKEFVELLSESPNFPLDGYVLVFFNGSENGGNSSYYTVDLDGYTTDVNGLLLIGSNGVSPTPQYLIPENTIQNGADAVAIYQASWFDFLEGTIATIDNLIDVIIYDTTDADDVDMIDIFKTDPNFSTIQQINEGSGNNTNSIQRLNDGSYTSKVPTPGKLNEGGGIDVNGIQMVIEEIQYEEGQTIDIIFSTEQAVSTEVTFSIILENDAFDNSDYTGQTILSIKAGENTTSTSIILTDDTLDEGDEVAIVKYDNLPEALLAINNNIAIRIVDNDYTVAPYGVPTSPTYGIVPSSKPMGYYSSLDSQSGQELRDAIQSIIADPSIVRAQTYTEVVEILKEADQNPANSNEVWLVYSEEGRPKLDFQTSSDNNGKWNREHTFPRSRAGYNSIDGDDTNNGVDIYWNTSADSLRHGNSDVHALRAADGQENSSRNNQHYGEYIGPSGTQGSFRGDVARSVLFLEIRYNGLSIVNEFPDIDGQLGDLSTLLEWHRMDPPDDFEMHRNNVVYNWQRNRNPFIDQPELVEYIWGDKVGSVWNQPLATFEEEELDINLYPNPTSRRVTFGGLHSEANIILTSIHGVQLATYKLQAGGEIDLDVPSGLYLLNINSKGNFKTLRVAVKAN